MVWKAKETRVDYPIGANKIVRCFAWLPIYINGDMVWLGFYQAIMIFEIIYHNTKIAGQDVSFSDSKWVLASKRLIPNDK